MVLAPVLFGCLKELPTKTGELPFADRETVAERVTRTNELAFKLYHQLNGPQENLLIAPHSIAVCAAMAYAGAQGTTRQQMISALCFWHSQENFHPTMKALTDTLLSRGVDQEPEAFRLRIVNGCWGADSWTYTDEYQYLLLTHYGAGLQMLDFAGHPEESRASINQWIAEQTEGRVQDLLPPQSIDAETYLVLANTIWLKASWLYQFDPNFTQNRGFNLLDGTNVQVPTMPGEGVFDFHRFEGFRAVELPYVGGAVSMYLILPDTGQFATFESGFDAGRLEAIVQALVPTYIVLELPKFSFESVFDLAATLSSLGMAAAFGPGANFTGMDGVDDGMPWIRSAAHKTFISVDEYGTEAAAGTAMWLSCGEHPGFDGNRPFLFVIRDNPTGTILFLGRVLDPRS